MTRVELGSKHRKIGTPYNTDRTRKLTVVALV